MTTTTTTQQQQQQQHQQEIGQGYNDICEMEKVVLM